LQEVHALSKFLRVPPRTRFWITSGFYKSVEEVVEAALTAVEQRTVPGFAGTPKELDTLLAEGLALKQLTEDEFWSSVGKRRLRSDCIRAHPSLAYGTPKLVFGELF